VKPSTNCAKCPWTEIDEIEVADDKVMCDLTCDEFLNLAVLHWDGFEEEFLF
jgi:hypothetical protein